MAAGHDACATLRREISPGLATAALAAFVDGQSRRSVVPLVADGSRVRIVTKDSPEALALYRHSTAHLMAAAVTNLFPGAQCGIGPATDEGFFYDFVVDRPFVPEDLDAIERKMKELAGEDLPYERQMWPREEAKRFFAARGEPLKVQLIEEKTAGQSEVSCYTIKDRGHVRRLLRRAARAVHGTLEGVQAAEHVERLLEGRRAATSRCSGSTGPPSLSDKELKAHLQRHRGSEEARSPEGRQGPRVVHVPHVGARRDVLAGQGYDAL